MFCLAQICRPNLLQWNEFFSNKKKRHICRQTRRDYFNSWPENEKNNPQINSKPEFSLLMVGLEDNLQRRRRLARNAHPAGLQLCSEPPLPDSPVLGGELILRSVSFFRSVRCPPSSLFPFLRRSFRIPAEPFDSFFSWSSLFFPTCSAAVEGCGSSR